MKAAGSCWTMAVSWNDNDLEKSCAMAHAWTAQHTNMHDVIHDCFGCWLEIGLVYSLWGPVSSILLSTSCPHPQPMLLRQANHITIILNDQLFSRFYRNDAAWWAMYLWPLFSEVKFVLVCNLSSDPHPCSTPSTWNAVADVHIILWPFVSDLSLFFKLSL